MRMVGWMCGIRVKTDAVVVQYVDKNSKIINFAIFYLCY